MTNNDDIAVLYLVSKHLDICNILYKIFGEPVDSYWNGSHTWFEEPEEWGDIRIEWRLHPVKGFTMPDASRPEELFELILENKVDPTHYLEGLEVFPVDENEISLNDFKEYVISRISIEPDFAGIVNHDEIGNSFELSNGEISIVELLSEQMKDF